MNYLSALAVVLGIVSGSISIYEFIKKGSWRPGVAFSVAAVVLLIAAVVVANLPSPKTGQALGTNPIGTSTQGMNITPTANSSPTPMPTPSPTPEPPGTVICSTANTGQGWDNWNLVPGWKLLNGELLYDGTGNGERMQAPNFCQPTTPNYAVDVRMRIVAACCHFGIIMRGNASSNGYNGYQLFIYTTTFQNVNITTQGGQGSATTGFSFDNNFHNYRGEVKNNIINFLIDGATIVRLTDNTFLSPGEVSICCTDTMELEITSFKVTAL